MASIILPVKLIFPAASSREFNVRNFNFYHIRSLAPVASPVHAGEYACYPFNLRSPGNKETMNNNKLLILFQVVTNIQPCPGSFAGCRLHKPLHGEINIGSFCVVAFHKDVFCDIAALALGIDPYHDGPFPPGRKTCRTGKRGRAASARSQSPDEEGPVAGIRESKPALNGCPGRHLPEINDLRVKGNPRLGVEQGGEKGQKGYTDYEGPR